VGTKGEISRVARIVLCFEISCGCLLAGGSIVSASIFLERSIEVEINLTGFASKPLQFSCYETSSWQRDYHVENSDRQQLALSNIFFSPCFIASEDMDDDELAVVNALLGSQEETIHQQRRVITMQKEKIRLLQELVDRREEELNSSDATNNGEVIEELRREVSRLRSTNQRLVERLAPQQNSLNDELDSGSDDDTAASAADDSKMKAASDDKDRPSKKARSEE